jgi:hypothetical protein
VRSGRRGLRVVAALAAAVVAAACSGPGGDDTAAAVAGDRAAATPVPTGAGPSPATAAAGTATPSASASAGAAEAGGGTLPLPGVRTGRVPVPAAGRAVNTSKPARVVGRGTAASCTSAALAAAVAKGGIVTFECGPAPVTIRLTQTLRIRNANRATVIDGGHRVTLSGGGTRRILYQNTCDQALGWTTSHCDDQDTPRLTVQNLTFADGNATGEKTEGGGGGAILVRGGHLKIINSRFVRNRCDRTGPDLGGAAVRVLDQGGDDPVYVVGSTFGGAAGQGGACSNGGALSSIGVSWVVLNTVISHNRAVGSGANPARGGTPGGGSGGAIYTDGNRFTVRIAGSRIERNHANEGGGAVFFVSNDRTGTMVVERSTLRRNPSDGFETSGLPGIFFLGAARPAIRGSTLS